VCQAGHVCNEREAHVFEHRELVLFVGVANERHAGVGCCGGICSGVTNEEALRWVAAEVSRSFEEAAGVGLHRCWVSTFNVCDLLSDPVVVEPRMYCSG
jgi:hypothetical protein